MGVGVVVVIAVVVLLLSLGLTNVAARMRMASAKNIKMKTTHAVLAHVERNLSCGSCSCCCSGSSF